MAESQSTAGVSAPVAIVGRGPVGMTLALRLADFGVPSILIDQLGSTIDPGSKAVVMHRHAVEVLSAVGVGEQMLAEGVAWTVSRTFRRGRLLFESTVRVEAGERPWVLNIPQARTEELLLEQVLRQALIEKCFEHRFVGLRQDDEGCQLTLAGPQGERVVRAAYVAGCDGARSATRRLAGIQFTGYAHDDVFRINDIVARLPFPEERRFYFDPPFNPGRTVLIHPQGPDQWHIDFQLGRGDESATEEPDRLGERIRGVIGDVDFTVTWSTTYRFKQLVADRFQAGRVFLVGDAAHLTSPYGARGLNSGLADADNLAWKLADVVCGRAEARLLSTYAAERRPAALENLRITGETARFMSPLHRGQRWRRDAILAVAARIPAARRWVNSGRFYEPADYRDATARTSQGLAIGTLVPDIALEGDASGPRRLADMLRVGPTVLLITVVAQDIAPALARAEEIRSQGLPCMVLVGAGPAQEQEQTPWLLRFAHGATPGWWPRSRLDCGLAILVRPDRYVSARRHIAVGEPWPDLRSWAQAAQDAMRVSIHNGQKEGRAR
jgi:2-polyprenyl-6-methoxyphenol hydroxylase-like FAD-dependent oxidoreductase